MKTFLFDDRGEKWDATSRSLASALCASISGAELANYAIRNLGYVSVSESNGSVRVRLRPAAVSPIAFSALCYYLMDRKPERIVLSRLERDWSHEFIGADVNVLRRLLHLVPVNHADRVGDFVSQTKRIEGIAPSNPLAALFKLWQEAGEALEYERIARLLEQGMSGRYVVVQTGETSSDVFLRAVGPGFLSYDDDWRARSTGLRVEDQPDYFYGRWVAQAYRDTTSDGAPRLEDVDAIVSTPRIGRSRVRYTRLIVPIRSPSGSECLLGASLIDSDIDLRVKAN
ncbi:MAG TPA: hypothetical protein VJ233_06115 [Hyphomicrobiaceae bacterium]|nr:hypothetical protein [Hyphomicrobiaceae bacterium]